MVGLVPRREPRLRTDRCGSRPPEALFWVHDYHLLLVPTALRELGVTSPVAFFVHTPFPAPSLFARLPQRSLLLDGLDGADLTEPGHDVPIRYMSRHVSSQQLLAYISLLADAVAANDVDRWADMQLDGAERAWADGDRQ